MAAEESSRDKQSESSLPMIVLAGQWNWDEAWRSAGLGEAIAGRIARHRWFASKSRASRRLNSSIRSPSAPEFCLSLVRVRVPRGRG